MSVYRTKKVAGRQYLLHRYVWERTHGPIPPGHVVHHINHDKVDNRLENLTLMTYAEHAAHHNDKHPRIKRCVVCGTAYEPSPTKRQRSQTCSTPCRDELLSALNVARYGKHLIECATCGTTFRVPRCKAGVARYCSRPCANRRHLASESAA